jgi:cytochrome c biogenesis protein CcmG/thiol:disulfide interchange protein DsbE
VKRWVAIVPLAVLAALAILFAGYALHHDPHVNPAALVGKTAPDLKLRTLDGGPPKALRTSADGPVLINFFASWCAPCVEETPALMALRSQGVRIIGVAYKDVREPSQPQRFLDQYGNPFTAIYIDPDGRAGVDFGVTGPPETFLVAPDGKVLAKYIGPLTPEAAANIVDKAGR